MWLGWKPCQRTYRTAPLPRRCTRSATSTSLNSRRSFRRAASAEIDPRNVRQTTVPRYPRSPRLRNPDQLRRGERCRLAPSQTAGQFWTPIQGQFSTPIDKIRTFRTMTRDLEALRDWLQELGVTQVGTESTGVDRRPVYAVLERRFDLIVGNARHIRNAPCRKTDVKDAEWIADLVRHGLIAKSFVPPAPQRELRELLRYRRKLVESQAAERNRLLKLLETANIKLASVASDGFGVSGRAMLKALIEGSASAEAMADLARGQLRRKRDDLVLALEGRMEEHHRFLLATQLRRLEAAEQDIAALDDRIQAKLKPYCVQHALLMQIPGVDGWSPPPSSPRSAST